MFLSNPAQYLLSFFNVIEILAECSATRSSLKQLKTITVAQSPRKPRRREKKYSNEEPGDIDDIDGLSADEKSSNDPLPHSFVFILKLWTLYAFIALYSRHVEPLFKYIPGYYVWNTGHAVCKCLMISALTFPQVPVTDLAFQYLWFHIQGIDSDLPYYYNRAVGVIKTQVTGVIDLVIATLVNLGNYEKLFHFIEALPIFIVLLLFPCFEEDEKIPAASLSTSSHPQVIRSFSLDEKETITLDSNGELLRVNFDDDDYTCSNRDDIDGSKAMKKDNLSNPSNIHDTDSGLDAPHRKVDVPTSGVTMRSRQRQQRKSIASPEDDEDKGDHTASADSSSHSRSDCQMHPETEPEPSEFLSSSTIMEGDEEREEGINLAPELDEDAQSALKESRNRLSRFSLLHPRDSIFRTSTRMKNSMSSLERIKANAKFNFQMSNSSNSGSSDEITSNKHVSRHPSLDSPGHDKLGHGSLKKKRFMVKKPNNGFY